MRFSAVVLLIALCADPSSLSLASQDTQTAKPNAKPLTNADVLDMLKAGLSQEIVVAKINASACEFDTSPAALKALKSASVPDPIILAMVKAGSGPAAPESKPTTTDEVSEPATVACAEGNAESVPVFSAAQSDHSPNKSATVSAAQSDHSSNKSATVSGELFRVKCGDKINILGDDKQNWLKMRTTEGRAGYISSALVSFEASAEQIRKAAADRKRDETQRAADELEDCNVRAQNEYETKSNAIGTMALSPMMRVYAQNRLKQNLDAELRACRSQYESRLKTIEAEQ